MNKITSIAFFIIGVIIGTSSSVANSDLEKKYICKTTQKSNWLHKYYQVEFLEINLQEKNAKFGNSQEWLTKRNVNVRDIPIGVRVEWSQKLLRLKEKYVDVTLSVRLTTDQTAELDLTCLCGRSNIKLECKSY